MKYLIVGLGNIGEEYRETRHNIGFMILDAFAKASNVCFEEKRYGSIAQVRIKNQTLLLLKPSTFMNLSGTAVRYWMKEEKIDLDHLLVVVDDLALPFGSLRLKPKGSDAGHNGLKNIQALIGTDAYARLRFGLGNEFSKGQQIEYVLGKFPPTQQAMLTERIQLANEMIQCFCLSGIQNAMNAYNNK